MPNLLFGLKNRSKSTWDEIPSAGGFPMDPTSVSLVLFALTEELLTRRASSSKRREAQKAGIEKEMAKKLDQLCTY